MRNPQAQAGEKIKNAGAVARIDTARTGFFAVWVFLCATAAFADPYWVFFYDESGRSPGDPVPASRIEAIVETGAELRTVTRYFNGVSVDYDGNPRDLERIRCVREVSPVRSYEITIPEPRALKPARQQERAEEPGEHLLAYGGSFTQLNMLNIPALHDRGYTGAGIVIGVLDAGFDVENTDCLKKLTVTHRRNFITGGENVSGHSHGTRVLSCLAGALDSTFYGPAFGAEFVLGLTEDPNDSLEYRGEEDYWTAGIEWCDSLGADIVSSSLVYNFGHNDPSEDYTKEDMDGRTSIVAQAAEIAAKRGITVVNAIGNDGAVMIGTPADAEHVIAVGAVGVTSGSNPALANFSSQGPTADGRTKPDVVGPGLGVMVQYLQDMSIVNGTSYATPIVAGLCALLLEAHPDWTPATVMAALKYSARDLGEPGPDNGFGWGLPDGLRALGYVESGIEDSLEDLIAAFILHPPYPNPFNSVLTIPFTIRQRIPLTIHIYSITGAHKARIAYGTYSPGEYRVTWSGGNLASGVYIVTVSAGAHTQAVKVLMIK